MTVRICDDAIEWDDMVTSLDGHPLQLWGWGELKSRHNWHVIRLLVEVDGRVVGGAQILERKTPWPFRSFLYIPRGPVGEPTAVLPALTEYLRANTTATHVAIEPHRTTPIKLEGWRRADKLALLARTIILNLERTEEGLLSSMAKKTRQYIRKSANSGIVVRPATAGDIERCLQIYRQTAERANFSLHGDQYYRDVSQLMGDNSLVNVAEYQGRVVAFLWLVATPEVAFELYGGMDQEGQRLRANYVLKWQTLLEMKRRGVHQYDMNGLLNDGVSSFKKGFSSNEIELAGTYEYRLSSWYILWRLTFPMARRVAQKLASLRK